MTADFTADQRILTGLGLRVLAVALMTGMVVLVRLAADQGAHVIESLFFRGFFGFLFIVAWMGMQGELKHIKTKKPFIHFSRTLLGTIAIALNFWAYTLMPMAEAATLSFTIPIFATAFSILFLSEVAGLGRWMAILVGFLGVLIVAQPGQNVLPLKGVIIGLSAAILSALHVIIMRILGRTERSSTMVFWYTAYSFPIVGFAYYFFAQRHAALVWFLFIGIGLLGAAGNLALAQSLKWAPVSAVVPMDYTHLIWSIFLGLFIWGEWPVSTTWIGASVIAMSGVYIVLIEQRSLKLSALNSSLEPHDK